MKELLTVEEAAERLKVCSDAVYKMIRRGDLVPVYEKSPRSKVGKMRLRAADVAAYKPRADSERRPKKVRGNSYHAALAAAHS